MPTTTRQKAAKPASAGRRGPSPSSLIRKRAKGAGGAGVGGLGSSGLRSVGRSLLADDRHQVPLELGRRVQLLDRCGQQVGGRAQPLQALAAGPAAGQMLFERGRLGGGQRAERVGREVVVALGAAAVIHLFCAHAVRPSIASGEIASAISARIFSRPSRIRPFTVPSGWLIISAISLWLKPPK